MADLENSTTYSGSRQQTGRPGIIYLGISLGINHGNEPRKVPRYLVGQVGAYQGANPSNPVFNVVIEDLRGHLGIGSLHFHRHCHRK